MSVKLTSIIAYLENLAPVSLQESYDNSGLLIGSPEQMVNKALITLDVTPEVIEEAVAHGCDLIIAHHPLIFKGLKRITGSSEVETCVIEAIRNHLAIYAIHTNLDNITSGVNSQLARKLDLINTRILAPKTGSLKKIVTFCPTEYAHKVRMALFDAGGGHIGNYSHCSFNQTGEGTFMGLENSQPFVGEKEKLHTEAETRIETIVPSFRVNAVINAMLKAHPYEEVAYNIYPLENIYTAIGSGMIGTLEEPMPPLEFLNKIKKNLGCQHIKHNQLIPREVQTVAICGGSGSFLTEAAFRAKADVFVTADVKYHEFFEHRGKMTIVDAGHFETEQGTKELLESLLTKNFPNFALRISKKNINPVSFL